ncbi:MAG: hypothetical protein GYB31_16695 [Bacteroidetes bacterium]|nr:hypothetical protein [Bacteroidota bacterium]
MKYFLAPLLFILAGLPLFGQEDGAYRTFKDTRVINAHSAEMLQKRKLDIRISHRFGDMFGASGGWATFYGLETAADILTGADYGVTDDFTVGLYRTKGAGDRKQLVNGMLKYRLVRQKAEGAPISLAGVFVSSLSTMPRQENAQGVASFPKFIHRFAFSGQVIIARKFSNAFSMQIMPGYTHRNLVADDDVNGIFSVGLAGRIQMTKVLGLILEGQLPLNGPQSPFSGEERLSGPPYQPAIGVGFEIDTGGHVFQINLTNSSGIVATDYLVNTRSNWLNGEFRLGFTISRIFNL